MKKLQHALGLFPIEEEFLSFLSEVPKYYIQYSENPFVVESVDIDTGVTIRLNYISLDLIDECLEEGSWVEYVK